MPGEGFKQASELVAGDQILLLDGSIKTIDKVTAEALETPVAVYNFTVEDWHTYFVGEQRVLVHNTKLPCEVTAGGNNGNAGNGIKAGKNFKNHFIRHKKLLQDITGKQYPKYKTHGQEFLDDINKVIDDGTVKYIGKGTLKKGMPAVNVYRGKGVTIIITQEREFVTILETGKGMDLTIEMIK